MLGSSTETLGTSRAPLLGAPTEFPGSPAGAPAAPVIDSKSLFDVALESAKDAAVPGSSAGFPAAPGGLPAAPRDEVDSEKTPDETTALKDDPGSPNGHPI
jgi:hypothetical protein